MSVAGRFVPTTEKRCRPTRACCAARMRRSPRLLDELAAVPGVQGAMMTFDDFVIGMEQFGTRIQPLMKSRSNLQIAA